MKRTLLVIAGLLMALPALAQTQSPSANKPSQPYESEYGYHPCATEKEAVIKACKKGDPCAKACLTAEKKMKKCSIANNLPTHQAGGDAQKKDCSTAADQPGAPVDATPQVGQPVNPLQSNHF
jgi:hypothetical protein